MNALLLLAALGVGGYFLMNRSNVAAVSLAKGPSGITWKVVISAVSGDTRTIDVYLPAGSLGPHGELRVLRYQITGTSAPVLLEVDPAAQLAGLENVVTLAKADIGIK